MFFYLSFLRAPKLQAFPSRPVDITINCANDLRTESFEGEQEIFYSWALAVPANSTFGLPSTHRKNTSNAAAATKPIKLTTWKPSIAYKEIGVPLPPGVRNGQSWRLILSGTGLHQPHTVDLQVPTIGRGNPFPVSSVPVTFSGQKTETDAKQEQIERAYRYGPEQSMVITLREQTSFDLDKKIWDSGVGLSSFIVQLSQQKEASTPLLAEIKDALFSRQRRNILELGSGVGIVALVASALRTMVHPPEGDRVIATDLETALPLLQHNIALNGHLFGRSPPTATVLDWYEDLPEDVISGGGFDMIIMADVAYNTESFDALIKTLSALVKLDSVSPETIPETTDMDAVDEVVEDIAAWRMAPSAHPKVARPVPGQAFVPAGPTTPAPLPKVGSMVKKTADSVPAAALTPKAAPDGKPASGRKPPLLLLGYKQRDPDERKLWDLARSVGIVFEKVGERVGASESGDGDEVEIWAGRVVV